MQKTSGLVIPTLSIPEQIAKHLVESIMAGRYQPGESLTEKALSDTFKVSRAPVREALRILERDGVVQIVPRHGARVTALQHHELLEALDIRAVLFGHSANLFATNALPEQIAYICRRVDELESLIEKSQNGLEYSLASGSIISFITDNCGNQRLTTLLRQLDFQVARYRLLGHSTVSMRKESYAYWRRLVVHLSNRESEAAERIGREMILRTRRAAERSFELTP